MAKKSGLTDAELGIRLADVVTENRPGTAQMVAACREFIEDPTGTLTLWGGVGTGKTMCLMAVVNELVGRGIRSVYVTAFDLFSNVREAFNPQREVVSDSAYDRLLEYEKVRVLAIDELDKVRPTEWMLEQLTHLVDKRHRDGLNGTCGTLIVMNSDPADQEDWIASRLGDGRNRVVHIADSDLRPMLKPAADE